MLYSAPVQIVPVSPAALKQAVTTLRGGGVVAHATETCYGLACDLRNPAAVEKLFRIKLRPPSQAVSALFATVEQAKEYLEWNDLAEALAEKYLPGPLTIILKQRKRAPARLFVIPPSIFRFPLSVFHFPFPHVGVRISPHPTTMRLVELFGAPLSTTSANVHGKPNPYSVEDIRNQYAGLADLPDLVLDEGPIPEKEASTVVDVSTGTVRVLRQGDIRVENAL